jgi:hypothetical protein
MGLWNISLLFFRCPFSFSFRLCRSYGGYGVVKGGGQNLIEPRAFFFPLASLDDATGFAGGSLESRNLSYDSPGADATHISATAGQLEL